MKEKNGITLIALIMTIIVLLILAGISISLVLGENGVLTQAQKSKIETVIGREKEDISIAYAGAISVNLENKVTAEDINQQFSQNGVNAQTVGGNGTLRIEFIETGNVYIINSEGDISDNNELENTDETKPYYPGKDFYLVGNTTLEEGLVISDGTNYWVWIEVPRKIEIYKTATLDLVPNNEGIYTKDECLKIENDLIDYTETLLSGSDSNTSRSGYEDIWYDRYSAIYDETLDYVPVLAIGGSEDLEEFKNYYDNIYTDETLTQVVETPVNNTKYYVKTESIKLDDNEGCGLTYEEYNNKKMKMLSSIYTNGGFWIGQYETGALSFVTSNDGGERTPVIQKGAYVYNAIRGYQAEEVAEKINSGSKTSSLLFGLQWDLVLKHLQNYGVDNNLILENSDTWGNSYNSTFEIDNGMYSKWTTKDKDYHEYTEYLAGYVENKIKISGKSVLLTTGASNQNKMMNIYDFAGNASERTLENSKNITYPCAERGGHLLGGYFSSMPVSVRSYSNISSTVMGFRISIY